MSRFIPTERQRHAVTEAVGYTPDDNAIMAAVRQHRDKGTTALRTELLSLSRTFRQNGGRGVEDADAIDTMRIALACRRK